MELYALTRGFNKETIIDEFDSVIWTERYFGDGDFQLSVEASGDMMAALPKGKLMMCEGSDEPMILETRDIKDGLLKTTGITITQWFNNRFIRTSADHAAKTWYISRFIEHGPPPQRSGFGPGTVLTYLVQEFCIDSTILDGTTDVGIPASQIVLFKIPGLVIGDQDGSGSIMDFSIPFGPLYDTLKDIATTYEIGMKTRFEFANDTDYQISFNTYKGADRTSGQTVNPVVRFSKEMDSLVEIDDLESITDHKNYVYTFAPSADPTIVTTAGFAAAPGALSGPDAVSGFDLRAAQEFVDTIPDGLDSTALVNILNKEALTQIETHKIVQLVDGQIVQVEGVQYGTNFFMGDIVEVEGNTGVLQSARVTEYIRSQDASGERAYPTLAMI